MWYQVEGDKWILRNDKVWVKCKKGWYLTQEGILPGQATNEQLLNMQNNDHRVKCKCSRKMARIGRAEDVNGETPWTNTAPDEEQSGFAHPIGFLVSHCEASHVKHTRGKRETVGWTGWEEDLLPPLAKPVTWDSSDARAGRVHHQPGSSQGEWVGEGARKFQASTSSTSAVEEQIGHVLDYLVGHSAAQPAMEQSSSVGPQTAQAETRKSIFLDLPLEE